MSECSTLTTNEPVIWQDPDPVFQEQEFKAMSLFKHLMATCSKNKMMTDEFLHQQEKIICERKFSCTYFQASQRSLICLIVFGKLKRKMLIRKVNRCDFNIFRHLLLCKTAELLLPDFVQPAKSNYT